MPYLHERAELAKKPRPFCAELPPKASDVEALALADTYLSSRGLSWAVAQANGWYPSWWEGPDGAYHLRIVIPCTSRNAGNRFWQARAVEDNVLPRYDSPAASRGDALVVVSPTPSDPSCVVAVVEGPMDALAAAGAGLVGVALMGIKPAAEVREHLIGRTWGRHAVFVADSDAVHGMLDLMGEVLDREDLASDQDTPVYERRLVMTYPYKDLAEIPPAQRKEYLECRMNLQAHKTRVVRHRPHSKLRA